MNLHMICDKIKSIGKNALNNEKNMLRFNIKAAII